jgi:ABC-type Fe3+ transport system substrate-binding protein
VQGWLNNLALSPYASEEKLLAAIDAGTCAVGIASGSALERHVASKSDSRLLQSLPAAGFFEIEAAGVARHAQHAENALRFVEWLIADAGMSSATLAGLSGRNVGLAGWHAEDAVKLAARRSYY